MQGDRAVSDNELLNEIVARNGDKDQIIYVLL